MTIVRVENLTKDYGSPKNVVSVLKGINLSIDDGEYVTVMGPSGSGKSTLLHLIGGLDRPTSGTVWLHDARISDLKDKELSRIRRQQLGFVFQFFNLIPVMSARENVAMPLILDGAKRAEALERADAMLAMVGLTDRATHRPAELSGGQQRVSIARALVTKPGLILCDEPTGALDTRTGEEVIKLLRTLVNTLKCTLVIVTHDPHVAAHSDRTVYIKDGEIVDDHRPTDEKRSTGEIRQKLSSLAAQPPTEVAGLPS
jgi:putative ABC transport system ATP-binding protein